MSPRTPTIRDDRDDDVLMAAYKAGEANAFRILLERHQGPVYRFCLRMLHSPEAATDATQEVFLRVVKHAPTWERRAKFTTWLYTIAKNYCLDEVRKANFRKTDSLDDPVLGKDGGSSDSGVTKLDRVAADKTDSAAHVDEKRLKHAVAQALQELPAEQREVFCLREYSGLAFQEIAAMTGAGENTVKSRMRYALATMRKSLQSAGFFGPDSS